MSPLLLLLLLSKQNRIKQETESVKDNTAVVVWEGKEMSKNLTRLCLNCNGEMIERSPGNYICSNCRVELTAEN